MNFHFLFKNHLFFGSWISFSSVAGLKRNLYWECKCMYKCGALSYFSKVSLLWGMSLVLFQMLSTFPTRFVESPSLLDAKSQNCLRWGIVQQCFRNLFTPKGTNFSVLPLVWSFPFSHLDFYVLHPIWGL